MYFDRRTLLHFDWNFTIFVHEGVIGIRQHWHKSKLGVNIDQFPWCYMVWSGDNEWMSHRSDHCKLFSIFSKSEWAMCHARLALYTLVGVNCNVCTWTSPLCVGYTWSLFSVSVLYKWTWYDTIHNMRLEIRGSIWYWIIWAIYHIFETLAPSRYSESLFWP